MTKNMYTVVGDGPCNEELALRIQAGDKNAAERFIAQNEGYLTELARAYTPWCEMEDLKQEGALALLDAAGRFDPAYGTKLLTYANAWRCPRPVRHLQPRCRQRGHNIYFIKNDSAYMMRLSNLRIPALRPVTALRSRCGPSFWPWLFLAGYALLHKRKAHCPIKPHSKRPGRTSSGPFAMGVREKTPPRYNGEAKRHRHAGKGMRPSVSLQRRAAAPPAPDAGQTWAPVRRSCK